MNRQRALRWGGWVAGLGLGLGALLLGFGCAQAPRETGLIFARASDAQRLDPADMDDGQSVNTVAQMCEGLLRFKPGTLEVEPWLAQSYTVSPDGLRYRFELRPGVKFHDGTALDADAVAQNFLRQMREDHPLRLPQPTFGQYWTNLLGEVTEVNVLAPLTVELVLREPNATLPASLASFPAWLLSPTAMRTLGAQIAETPVGTGPFRFKEWRRGEALVLEPFADYWGGAPELTRLVLLVIPDNAARVLRLRNNRAHAIDGVPPGEASKLRVEKNYTVFNSPGLNVGYLAFSEKAARLRDPRVRHALAAAIDRAALVRLGLEGYGRVAEYPLPPGSLGVPAGKTPPIAYDPTAARATLAQFPALLASPLRLATFSGARDYFPDPNRIASLIKNDLEQVGLQVEISSVDFQAHLDLTRRGDFELALLGWIGDNGDPDNFLASLLTSWAGEEGSATNISLWKNESFDRLILEARRTSDRARRQSLYEAALAVWATELPLVPLVHGEQIVVFQSNFSGYVPEPTAVHFFAPVRRTDR